MFTTFSLPNKVFSSWYRLSSTRTKLCYLLFSFGPVSMSPHHAHICVAKFQSQNRGHMETIINLSNVFNVLHYIPCCQFLPVVSYRSISSPYLSSLPSSAAVAHSLTPARFFPLFPSSLSHPASWPPHRLLAEFQNRTCRNLLRDRVLPL